VERGEDLGEDLADRRAGGEVGLLSQVGDVGRTKNASRVGLVGASEQAQQGGLADAVLTDEADRLARVATRSTPSRTVRSPKEREMSRATRGATAKTVGGDIENPRCKQETRRAVPRARVDRCLRTS